MPKVKCTKCSGTGFVQVLADVEPSLKYPEGYDLHAVRAAPNEGPPKLACEDCKGQGWKDD